MKPAIYQFLLGSSAAFGSFLFGYDHGAIAEVISTDDFKAKFLRNDANAKSGAVASLFTAGCFLGAALFGYVDFLGRRGTIVVAAIIFIIGGIVWTIGLVIEMLDIGRLVAGLGTGLLVVSMCVYFTPSIADRRRRLFPSTSLKSPIAISGAA